MPSSPSLFLFLSGTKKGLFHSGLGALNPIRRGMRSETDFADNQVSRTFKGGVSPPFSMRASTDGGGECRGANIRSSPSEGVNASALAEGGTSAFSWVADPSSRLVVTATNSRYFLRHLALVPFGEGTMRRTGSGWDRSFFRSSLTTPTAPLPA